MWTQAALDLAFCRFKTTGLRFCFCHLHDAARIGLPLDLPAQASACNTASSPSSDDSPANGSALPLSGAWPTGHTARTARDCARFLPFPTVTSSATLTASAVQPVAPPLRRRVLVVDDDPLSRSFQTHLLSLLGYDAQAQGDPALAVQQASDGGFDLLLLDLGMPGLDGFEVLRRLREREAREGCRPLGVVAVTGYASESDRVRCLAAGFNEHLAKPIQAATLGRVLAQVLGSAAGADAPAEDSDVARLRATVKRLNEARPGDRSFAPTITESFALRSAQLLETLRRSLRERDPAATAKAAQAMRASAEFLGAMRLATMCAQLEAHAAAGEWSEAEQSLASMNDEHQVVLTLLFESAQR